MDDDRGMAAMIRAHDWSQTALGPFDEWPQSLKAAVDIVLGAGARMAIFWGPDFLLLYNDPYGTLLGDKHPGALGRPAREVFPEIWDTVGPSFSDVMTRGQPVERHEELLPLDRSGAAEDAWFDYTLNPLFREDGSVGGVLAIAVEVTARVRAERDHRRLNEILEARVEERTRQLHERECALRKRWAQVSLILDRLPVGVGVADRQGRILSLNGAGLRLHGSASLEEMPVSLDEYRELFELRDASGRAMSAAEWPLMRALAGEDVHDCEVVLRRRDGRDERIVSYSAVRVFEDEDMRGQAVFVMHDITERMRAEDDLRRAHDLIEGITKGTQDMIAAEDGDFRFLFFNDAYRREFARLWGQEIEVGTSMIEAMAPWPEEQRKARELWARALGGESFITTMEFGPSEEDRQIYDLRFNPVRDAWGRVIGAAHIFRNVTGRVRTQQALRVSEERLRDAHRRKDEYLAMLGHELRNPLAAIRNATELLRRARNDDERIHRACGVLERQSFHMARLVDGLLEVSRIARGKVHLELECLDVRDVLQSVLQDRAADLAARGLELERDTPGEPVWTMGDSTRLAQVFDNLVGNAIKFTDPPGSVRVELEAGPELAVIRVRDTGVGIRPEMLPRIFDAFQQETQDVARSTGGLGLGLALARGLVELHGGSIEAHSAGPGTGAAFEIRLPSSAAPAEATERDAAPAVPCRQILVVEDNVDAAEMLRALLELQEHHVTVAESGPVALDVLRSRGADVVLCDLGLPGMSGYELARAIRRDPALCHVLLVALTGYGQPDDRRRTAEAGFDEHLIKPIDLRALDEALTRMGQRARE